MQTSTDVYILLFGIDIPIAGLIMNDDKDSIIIDNNIIIIEYIFIFEKIYEWYISFVLFHIGTSVYSDVLKSMPARKYTIP